MFPDKPLYPIPSFDPNPVIAMVQRYGPIYPLAPCVHLSIRREAWVGDRLLAVAVALVAFEELDIVSPTGIDAVHEPLSNQFLGGLLMDEHGHSMPCVAAGDKARGTQVECALYRLYRAEGMDAVITIARYMLSRSGRVQDVLNGVESIPVVMESSLHAETRPIFVPAKQRAAISLDAPKIAPFSYHGVLHCNPPPPDGNRGLLFCEHTGRPVGYIAANGSHLSLHSV